MNSLVHQSSYPIYISYSSAISGFQSENIRDVGIDCLPKTDQKETVANFTLIRLPRHRLSPNFLFCCKFPTHLKHIHLRLDTCLRRPGCSSQLIHFIELLGSNFSINNNGLEAFPISLVLQYASIFLHAQYLLLKQKSLKKVVFGSRKVSTSIIPSAAHFLFLPFVRLGGIFNLSIRISTHGDTCWPSRRSETSLPVEGWIGGQNRHKDEERKVYCTDQSHRSFQ